LEYSPIRHSRQISKYLFLLWSISFWTASKVYSGHLPTWNNRLKKNGFVIFGKRNQTGIIFNINYKYPLPWIFFLIRVLDYIEQISLGKVENNFFKRDTSIILQLLILFIIPVK